MKKAFWSHFKHFGRLLGNIYLFFTPSKTDGWVPSQQAAPTTCTYNLQPDLLESFPSDVCPDITVQFGCGHRAKFSPSEEGGGGGVGRKLVWSSGEINPISGGGGRSGGFWQIGNPVDNVIHLLNNWGLVFCNQPGYWSLENAIRCFHFISPRHYPLC